ncbi:MAG: pyridoxine 5'-phosphate synthase [Planctomycetota bacterium]
MIRLGVNIDHVATVRQARRANEPDPVRAAVLAELGGADGITVHLRQDRRHINDRDVRLLRQTIATRLNLEMAAVNEIVDIALAVRPDQVTLVPEKREELTTEGGLDAARAVPELKRVVDRFRTAGIPVSLFIDPVGDQIKAAADTGAAFVELHTGTYAGARGPAGEAALNRLVEASRAVADAGLGLFAGHGLTYQNVHPVLQLQGLQELNIGHSIIARAVLVGMERAVHDMKTILACRPG